MLTLAAGDQRVELANASLGQEAITTAPAVIVLSEVLERGPRQNAVKGENRLFILKAGHAAQNI